MTTFSASSRLFSGSLIWPIDRVLGHLPGQMVIFFYLMNGLEHLFLRVDNTCISEDDFQRIPLLWNNKMRQLYSRLATFFFYFLSKSHRSDNTARTCRARQGCILQVRLDGKVGAAQELV
ncbi:hypothetical protein BDZ91DRAFT_255698 [Kalaharituber pfeilii]|nr:hypothetical protein BDZ91DRAFT_255698 [Kalaharituber pfeilii]